MNLRLIGMLLMSMGSLACSVPRAVAAPGDSYAMTWKKCEFFNQQRDFVIGAAVDSQDKLYVSGQSGAIYGSGGGDGARGLAAKYNSAGTRQWLTYAYDTLNLEHTSGIAIDSSDNLFVAGETYRYSGGEAFLVKYNQNGTRLWERHVGSADNEFGADVAVDALGNAYMSGSTTGDLGTGSNGLGYDGFIVKYGPTGNTLWTMQFPDSLGDFADTISVDPTGNIFVTGSVGVDTYVAKLDSNRNVRWRITPNFSTIANRHTELFESIADSVGNLYVVGGTNARYDNGQGFLERDAVVAKFDPAGSLLWQRPLSFRTLDAFTAVALDSVGNVYVAGETFDSPFGFTGASNSLWAKYDSSGTLLWSQEFGTAEVDGAQGIAVDHAGVVYITGNIVRDVNNYFHGDADAYVARFDAVPEPSTFAFVLVALTPVSFGRRARLCKSGMNAGW